MEDFKLFFQLGWGHIISLDALDHLLFIAALTSLYNLFDWRKVLILITSFTIGHSLTLALASLSVIQFNNSWIEFLIPLTIIINCIFNVIQKEDIYFPLNSALRFSTKAAMPSFWSSVANNM